MPLGIGLRKQRPFTPTQLSGCVLWLRADLGVTLNGSTVSAWADQSGAGNNLTQGVAAHQPTYTAADAAYKGKPTLSFVSDHAATYSNMMSGAFAGGVIGQPNTVLVVGNDDNVNNSNTYFDGRAGTGNRQILQVSSSNWQIYAGTQFQGAQVPLNLNPQIFVCGFAGGAGTLRISKNTSEPEIGIGTNGLDGITLGSYQASQPVTALNGKIAEVVAYNRTLAQWEIARLNSYLGSRYNITIGA